MNYQRFENDGLPLEETGGCDPAAAAAITGEDAESKTHHEVELNFEQQRMSEEVEESCRQPNKTYFDQIEVEIVGGGSKEADQTANADAIINANDFFLENNDNYRLSWEVKPSQLDGNRPKGRRGG